MNNSFTKARVSPTGCGGVICQPESIRVALATQRFFATVLQSAWNKLRNGMKTDTVDVCPGPRICHVSFARFFNSANARPARRPSLVAVESSSLAWSARPASNALNQRRKRAS